MKIKFKNIYYYIPLIVGFFLISFYFLKDPYDSLLNEKQYYNSVLCKDLNLVFYKKGCPYCKASKKEVVKNITKSDITSYVVNVDTKEGKILAHKYNVKYAPTIVSIRDKKINSFLYAYDKKGKIYVEKKKIKEVFRK